MTEEVSIIEECLEYAELLRGRCNRREVVVELTLFLYTNDEWEDLSDYQIKKIINIVMDDL